MDINKLQQKLMAAARSEAPDDRVPFAFEKRILARIAGQPIPDTLALWAQALWRAVAPCMAVSIVLCTWTLLSHDARQATGNNLRQDLENTLLASVPTDNSISW